MEIIKYNMMQDDLYKNELVEECRYDYPDSGLQSPENIVSFVKSAMQLDRQSEERIIVIAFTARMKAVGVFEVSHGTIRTAVISPDTIFRRLLLLNASCYAMIHNHPSGGVGVEPSKEDRSITKRLKAASVIMGLPLIDHIIVGNGSYYSFKESGGL